MIYVKVVRNLGLKTKCKPQESPQNNVIVCWVGSATVSRAHLLANDGHEFTSSTVLVGLAIRPGEKMGVATRARTLKDV